MRYLGRIFFTGLVAVVPLALTAALLVWLGVNAEKMLGATVKFVLPDAWVFPGLGVILGIALVFGIGILMQLWVVQQLFNLGEALLGRIPLVKTVYGSIKDIMDMFSRGDRGGAGRPVIVRLPGRDEAVLGFVTRSSVDARFGGNDDTIAVYMPMSYQVGGYTVLMPRERVEPLEVGAQEAMRFVLTAGMGMTGKAKAGSSAGDSTGKSPGPS